MSKPLAGYLFEHGISTDDVREIIKRWKDETKQRKTDLELANDWNDCADSIGGLADCHLVDSPIYKRLMTIRDEMLATAKGLNDGN